MPSVEWNRSWQHNLRKFREKHPGEMYGMQWSDPDVRGLRYWIQKLLRPSHGPGPLYKVVDRYIRPYVKASSTVLEIGPGGGRWTRYLVGASKVICVDISPEFFEVLAAQFPDAKLEFYLSEGYELAGISDDSVDFVFSFGAFVHIEPDGIVRYLAHIRRVLKPGGIAVVHYAEKRKPKALRNPAFSDMTAEKMVAIATLPIIDHETRMLKHSNIVVFQKEKG